MHYQQDHTRPQAQTVITVLLGLRIGALLPLKTLCMPAVIVEHAHTVCQGRQQVICRQGDAATQLQALMSRTRLAILRRGTGDPGNPVHRPQTAVLCLMSNISVAHILWPASCRTGPPLAGRPFIPLVGPSTMTCTCRQVRGTKGLAGCAHGVGGELPVAIEHVAGGVGVAAHGLHSRRGFLLPVHAEHRDLGGVCSVQPAQGEPRRGLSRQD